MPVSGQIPYLHLQHVPSRLDAQGVQGPIHSELYGAAHCRWLRPSDIMRLAKDYESLQVYTKNSAGTTTYKDSAAG